MLSPHGATLVLWVHVLAASVWIGGQITIALLVPMLRGDPALLASAARRYQQLAWPAFTLLVVTGVVNAHNAGITWSGLIHTATGRTLTVKLGFVALSGVTAALHAFLVAPRASSTRGSASRAASAILGSLSLLTAIVAAFYGVVIAAQP